jgi:hypothetical protein
MLRSHVRVDTRAVGLRCFCATRILIRQYSSVVCIVSSALAASCCVCCCCVFALCVRCAVASWCCRCPRSPRGHIIFIVMYCHCVCWSPWSALSWHLRCRLCEGCQRLRGVRLMLASGGVAACALARLTVAKADVKSYGCARHGCCGCVGYPDLRVAIPCPVFLPRVSLLRRAELHASTSLPWLYVRVDHLPRLCLHCCCCGCRRRRRCGRGGRGGCCVGRDQE